MSALESRIVRLERRKLGGAVGANAPSESEYLAARAASRRYFELWEWPKILHEVCDGTDTLDRPVEAPSLTLNAEDRAFVEECQAGAIDRFGDVIERYERLVFGHVPRTNEWIEQWLGEPSEATEERV